MAAEDIQLTIPADAKELARALKRTRSTCRVSADAMADHCEVHKNTVYNWERRGNISASDLVRYLHFLGFRVTAQCLQRY